MIKGVDVSSLNSILKGILFSLGLPIVNTVFTPMLLVDNNFLIKKFSNLFKTSHFFGFHVLLFSKLSNIEKFYSQSMIDKYD